MILDTVDVFYVVLPLIYPWRTAYGEDQDIHTVIVRLRSGDLEGWGETSPLAAPTYSPEFAMSVFTLIGEWLAPRVVGQDFGSADDLLACLSV